MPSLESTLRPGPLGALTDETQRAVDRFVAAWEGLDATALDAQRQAQGELRTVRQVAEHVLHAAHIYLNLQRRAFGLDPLAWVPPPADPAGLRQELRAIPDQAWSLLRDKADWDDERLCAVRMTATWGQEYDLEQLLEHALVHVLRHSRQVEGWLAPPAAAGRP